MAPAGIRRCCLACLLLARRETRALSRVESGLRPYKSRRSVGFGERGAYPTHDTLLAGFASPRISLRKFAANFGPEMTYALA